MGYRTLAECVADLERNKQLVRVSAPVDPDLELAEIQRRVYQAKGPALLFEQVKGSRFPVVSNLFGTLDRARFLFRDSLEGVRRLLELKIDPDNLRKRPWRYISTIGAAWSTQPRSVRSGPVVQHETSIRELPQIKSWPDDGGAFITLPQVYTEDPDRPGVGKSNLGMYRVQLSGGEYVPNREIGLHYQIHRGIGVHHAAAVRRGEKLKVNIFVGGPPAMTLSAVMPLPEGLPELFFAGALGGRRISLVQRSGGLPIPAEADFCICGTIDPDRRKPEGPFGDHLGYYSLVHDFPVLTVEKVYHRPGAIWPYTAVGRPPQEDTSFGEFIHELTGPVIPTVVHGVSQVHAVDAAGVHPLLLAIGSERYTPYEGVQRPMELLTQANAILGQGQLSLAKYLLIVAKQDQPDLDLHDMGRFFDHLLSRIDWERDLHFQTRTTIDTLDYSGSGLNAGSKVVWAAAGPKRRELPTAVPSDFSLPDGFHSPKVCLPGVLAIQGPPADGKRGEPDPAAERFAAAIPLEHPLNRFPLVVLVDDSGFTAQSFSNFVWVAFTRSNPASDLHGIGAFTHCKHWGCRGSLVIDARRKPWYAPPLIEDPAVTKRVDALAAPGGPLHGVI